MSIITDAIKSNKILFKAFGPGDDIGFVNLDDYEGLAFILKGQPVILVKKGMPPARQRFTAAHELGHIVLGHVDNEAGGRCNTTRDIELEADLFAVVMTAFAYAMEQVEAKLETWRKEQSWRPDPVSADIRPGPGSGAVGHDPDQEGDHL